MRLVGRRVKIIKAEDSYGALGKIGVVVANGKEGPLVKIKGWNEGHCGNFETGNEYWFFSRKALRLLPKRRRRPPISEN